MGDMREPDHCLAGQSSKHQTNAKEVRGWESNDALQSRAEAGTLGEAGKGGEFATGSFLRSVSQNDKPFGSTLAGCQTHQLPSPDKNTGRVRSALSEDIGTSTKHLEARPVPHDLSRFLEEDGDIRFPDSRELMSMSKDQWDAFKAAYRVHDEAQARSQEKKVAD